MTIHYGDAVAGRPASERKDEMVGDPGIERERRSLEARLDAVGWGVLFIVVGGVLLAPDLHEDTWLVAAGAVMLGVSVARALLGLAVPWITMVAGTAAFVGGGAGVLGLESAGGPLVLVALGVAVIGLGFYRGERAGALVSAASSRR
jgi:hypothetical protein